MIHYPGQANFADPSMSVENSNPRDGSSISAVEDDDLRTDDNTKETCGAWTHPLLQAHSYEVLGKFAIENVLTAFWFVDMQESEENRGTEANLEEVAKAKETLKDAEVTLKRLEDRGGG